MVLGTGVDMDFMLGTDSDSFPWQLRKLPPFDLIERDVHIVRHSVSTGLDTRFLVSVQGL